MQAPLPAVGPIAKAVERLRGLRLDAPPVPQRVSAAQARRDGLAEFDRSEPPRRRRADETLAELLGLLPPGSDLRRLVGSVFGEQVAGYYDPRSRRLRLVDGPAA